MNTPPHSRIGRYLTRTLQVHAQHLNRVSVIIVFIMFGEATDEREKTVMANKTNVVFLLRKRITNELTKERGKERMNERS